jgi:hypothetical protein
VRELESVGQTEVADWGHAIKLDLQYADGSKETLKIPYALASALMLAINQTAAAAERAQKAQPGQEISLEVPVVATDVQAGIVAEGGSVAFRFLTTIGAPIIISMSPDIGRRAIERLSDVLVRIQTQPPFRLS